MESKWYEHFFHGLAVDLWSAAVTDEQTRDEVDFIVQELELGPGARILDIACGEGRHSIELSRRGYAVSGIDLSEVFMTRAHQNAAAAGVTVDWIKADMNQLSAVIGDRMFDGAFCLGNSFGYAGPKQTGAFLDGVSSCLKSGSRVVLETGTSAESLLPNLQTRSWHRIADIFMLREARYDVSRSCLETEYTFLRGAEVQTGTATYYVHTIAELKRLFAESGLEVQHLYGSTNRNPYCLGDPRLLLIAGLTQTW